MSSRQTDGEIILSSGGPGVVQQHVPLGGGSGGWGLGEGQLRLRVRREVTRIMLQGQITVTC